MHPHTSLAGWQLAAVAVVAVTSLAAWLTAVYLAARDPVGHNQAAAGSAPGAAATRTSSRSRVPTGEREPERPPADRAAA